MPQVPCPSCGKVLAIGDHLAGAKVRCPGCKTVFQVPAAVPVAQASIRPPAPAVPQPASDNPFEFGGGPQSPLVAPGAAFANLEDDSTEHQRFRRRAARAAAAMYRAVMALIAVPLICFVLNLFVGGAMGVPGGAILAAFFIGLVVIAFIVAVPVTFMAIGGRCLERRSSAGLAMTGAIFATLAGASMAIFGLLSVLSIVVGNFIGLIAGPLYLLGAAADIYAGVVALGVTMHPDAREAFGQR